MPRLRGRTVRLWSAAALVFTGSGCSPPFSPGELSELAAARRKWEARGFTDYTFETQHGCFCLPEDVGPVRITVRDGVITEVTMIETGQPVSSSRWYTIEQLYDRIPGFAAADGVDDVAVQYHETLGYPISVSVSFEEGILDAGSLYTISAVGPAP
jgi:hypothetical protein